ncbi:MAG TPA: carboxypeptidase regulatory-like domain-containing protein [Verrucomicrobiae bacterium]|jgi:outer membrane receptor protein involved in Fe transport|nr:carboxypeptidase regulatory-like domain-containing protein [Verrucomicrobiae bacterium]
MSKRIAFSRWIWILPLVLISAVAAFAQNTASIQGTVTDSSGAAVVGANVVVKSASQGLERTTQTGSAGNYEVPALPPGSYSVEVQMSGFQSQQANDVVVAVSQNSVQNFSLKPASATEVVTVEATVPVIETTTMTVGQSINQRTVQDIPLNGRHFVDLALLVPGTVVPPQNGFLTAPLRGQGSFAFNSAGGREDAVNFMINGINLNDMVQNQVTFQPTINTVSEFKIDNSTYSAEFGRNSGSIVNIATRSGTDEFHGELYDYLRNNWFDARNAFNSKTSLTGSPLAQSPFKRNQFGADFGGPLHRGTTYFFLSYEGLRHRQGLNTASNVLSDADRAAVQAGTNAVAKALLPFIPAANSTLGAAPAFQGSATAPVDIDQGTADISHNFSNADNLHGYYVYQRDLRQESTQGASIPGFGDTRSGHRQVLTLNETHVFSSNVVNEFRLGANRIHLTFTPNNTTLASAVGINFGPNPAFIPTIRIQGPGFGTNLLFGAERNFPQGRGDTGSEIADVVSYVRGRHSFKFGGEFRDFRNDNFNNDPGQLIFSSVTNFKAGTVASFARNPGNIANRINQNALDFFAQDSWKLSPSFTLELGLRYAWNMTPSEALNRFVAFQAGPGTTGILTQGVNPYGQNNNNFQPRLGFSWDVFHSGKTVLRSGYGYQVDQPITGYVTGLTSNPPFGALVSVNGANSLANVGAIMNGPPASISPTAIDPHFKNANVQSWNLNIQQEVDRNTSLMVGYFGSKGTHLQIDRNINQPLNPADPTSSPLKTLGNTVGNIPAGTSLSTIITEHDSSGTSTYNALWISANRKLARGVQFNASYTWSHSIDQNSRNAEGTSLQNSLNIAGDKGSSDFDARHRFVANAIYDLPFKGNRFVAGWELATILSLQSGNPLTLSGGSTGINGGVLFGGLTTIRPDLFGTVNITGNPAAWFSVTPGTLVNPTNHFGNLGRNNLYGPGFADADLSLIKTTKITEKVSAQLRLDAFDAFNHPNFGQPSLSYVTGATTFGAISSTRFPAGDSGSSRQLQFAMKLLF